MSTHDLDLLIDLATMIVVDLKASHPNSIRNRRELVDALVGLAEWNESTIDPAGLHPVNDHRHG